MIIYLVTRQEYNSCIVTNPVPKVVLNCTAARDRLIAFRPVSPHPGGLQFQSGEEYFFISTSSSINPFSRVGGPCITDNMKLTIKIAEHYQKSLDAQKNYVFKRADRLPSIDYLIHHYSKSKISAKQTSGLKNQNQQHRHRHEKHSRMLRKVSIETSSVGCLKLLTGLISICTMLSWTL